MYNNYVTVAPSIRAKDSNVWWIGGGLVYTLPISCDAVLANDWNVCLQ